MYMHGNRNYLELDIQSFEKVRASSPPRYRMLAAATAAAVDSNSTGEAARKKQKLDESK